MHPLVRIAVSAILSSASMAHASAQPAHSLCQPPREQITKYDESAINDRHMQLLAVRNGTQKITATISRLIANSSNRPGLYDSCYYRYSSNERGGDDGKTVQGGNTLRTSLQCDTGVGLRLWSSSSSAFVPNQRLLKSFDAQHHELSHTMQNWVTSGWQNGYRNSFWYDAADRDTQVVTELWIDANSSWLTYSRERRTYNSSGLITHQTVQAWDGVNAVWINESRYSTSYDAAGNQILFLRESWDGSAASWRNYERTTYAYNSADKLLSYAFEEWNMATNAWEPEYGALYSYNTSNHLIAVVSRSGQSGTWVNTDSLAHISLNGAGQPLTSHAYNRISGSWNLARRTTNTYTAANLLAVSLIENWNGSAFVNNRRSFTFYNNFDQRTRHYTESWNSATWVIGNTDRDDRFHYETVTTGIAKTPAQPIQAYLFPVPATRQLTLAMQWPAPQRIIISLCDVSGKLLQHWEERVRAGVYTNNLAVEVLPAGIYFLRVQGEQDGWSGRFSVVH